MISIMRRSEEPLTQPDSQMSIASMESLQEQWLESPVQTGSDISIMQILISLNMLQMNQSL